MCKEISNVVFDSSTANMDCVPVNGLSVQEWDGDMKTVSTTTSWHREGFWQEHVSRFRAEGMSANEYAAQNNLKAFQLQYWNRKFA